jgi:hypothetical protein
MNTQPNMLAADHIRELVKPYATHTVIERLTPGGLIKTIHTVHHPSLLDQLRNAGHGSTNLSDSDASRGIATSKPAAHLEALDVLARIDRQAAALADELNAGTHLRLETRLLAIAGMVGDDTNSRVRSWWAAARLVTHHDTPPIRPHAVPCPHCWELNSLRIRLEDDLAACVQCGTVWDRTGQNGSLLKLGEYVQWCGEHQVTKPRHWQFDDEGYPVECVECLSYRDEYAQVRLAQANVVDKMSNTGA